MPKWIEPTSPNAMEDIKKIFSSTTTLRFYLVTKKFKENSRE